MQFRRFALTTAVSISLSLVTAPASAVSGAPAPSAVAAAVAPAPPAPSSDLHPHDAPSPRERQENFRLQLGRRSLLPSFSTAAASRLSRLHIPVLLVDFPGRAAERRTHTPDAFRRMLFKDGYSGGAGSLRDYYQDQSEGRLDITGSVSRWKRLPHSYAHYTGSQYGYQDAAPNSQTMVADAVAAADGTIDFCRSDSNGDGTVDTLFLVHSGPGAEETGSGIWSISWWTGTPVRTDDVCADGRRMYVNDFTIQPEEYSEPGMSAPGAPRGMVSIGVFAHELGHALGLPDLYDTDFSNPGGVGPWDVMATGGYGFDGTTPWRPTPMSAWTRGRLGWTQTENISATALGLDLDVVGPGKDVLRVAPGGSASASEYFLVENRRASGWAADLPASGVLVWHIDEDQRNNNNSRHLVHLVQADSLNELGNSNDFFERGDPGDMFTGPQVLGPATSPSSDLYGDVVSGITIKIKSAGDVLARTVDVLL